VKSWGLILCVIFGSSILAFVIGNWLIGDSVAWAERQNRKLLEQLEEQKKRLRMQNQQHGAGAATTGWVFVCACFYAFSIYLIYCCKDYALVHVYNNDDQN